jgi:hypothetical protein
MTKTESKTASTAVKDILLANPDGLHEVIRAVMQEAFPLSVGLRTHWRRIWSTLGSSKHNPARSTSGEGIGCERQTALVA